MLPLPAVRGERTHKRVSSFKSELILRAKDDDLVLFNEMQNKEGDNFLLHTSDDVNDSLSKLRYVSDSKLGFTTPILGESSDLLNVDGEKSDYDWLLTPPGTPLFPSLDDEEPQPQELQPRGRPRTQPTNISRSLFINEKSPKNSRSRASPHRLSPSPRSNSYNGQFRLRPSSAPRSSPPSSQRPSTPPNKPSTPTPRSLTPTLWRMGTGSSRQASSSGRRGSSPIRASHGSTTKLQGWQSNLSSFASDAPSSLRTSPHVRSLSPTPRSGKGRQSLSPTASRSAISSYSDERDKFRSSTKGSVVSSRTSPANSVPKRSFQPVPRLMDHRKTPQNMFRPLLSNVPATSIYVGKANNSHKPMVSRNSSFTTSTSANSIHGASVAPNIASEQDQNDLAGEVEKTQDPDTQEEVFVLDNVDIVEDNNNEVRTGDNNNEVHTGKPLSGSGSFEGSTVNFGVQSSIATAAESTYASGNFSVVDSCEILKICSKCGKSFQLLGLDGMTNVCQECAEIDELVSAAEPLPPSTLTHNLTVQSELIIGMDIPVDEVEGSVGISKLPEESSGEVMLSQHELRNFNDFNCMDNNHPLKSVMDHSKLKLSEEQLETQQYRSFTKCDSQSKILQARAFSATNAICSVSYVRDNTRAIKNSFQLDNSSASVDLALSRQTEVHIRCQNEPDSVRSDDANCQHSALPINASEPLVHPGSDMEENFNSFTKAVEYESLQESNLVMEEHDSSFNHIAMSADSLKEEHYASCINADEDPWRVREKLNGDIDLPNSTVSSIISEKSVLNSPFFAMNSSSFAILEAQNDCVEALHEPCVSTTQEKSKLVSTMECGPPDYAHGLCEDSIVIIHGSGGHMSRSLTLEEATDTILFCSSIVHDIAYKAAAIGMEKDSGRPTVTILRKINSNSNQNSAKMLNKRMPKSPKFKRKKSETQTKSPLTELENNVTFHESTQSMNAEKKKALDSTNPPKLESKCNCTVM